MSEVNKHQLSFFVGESKDQFVVRTDSTDETQSELRDLTEKIADIISLVNDVKQAYMMSELKTQYGSKPSSSGSGPGSGLPTAGPPSCVHGVMRDLDGKVNAKGEPYRNRYYCPAPRNEKQCPAKG